MPPHGSTTSAKHRNHPPRGLLIIERHRDIQRSKPLHSLQLFNCLKNRTQGLMRYPPLRDRLPNLRRSPLGILHIHNHRHLIDLGDRIEGVILQPTRSLP